MASASAPVVETTAGRVSGVFSGRVVSFKGIPYGSSVGGRCRFQPPTPAEPWTGVLPAASYGDSAPQYPAAAPAAGYRAQAAPSYREGVARQSESCLTLNV